MTIGLVNDGCSVSRQAIASACWSAPRTKIAERYWQRRRLRLAAGGLAVPELERGRSILI
jgi:hypothetical protein